MADLDGKGVFVAGVGGVGPLRQGNALKHFPLQSHNKVGAGVNLQVSVLQALKIAAVGFRRGAGIAHVVDDDSLHLLQLRAGAGPWIHRQKLLRHIVRQHHRRRRNTGAKLSPNPNAGGGDHKDRRQAQRKKPWIQTPSFFSVSHVLSAPAP
ncbi:hypothetical protein SDC9_113188 [bioreactor metagenome]|uniref:Uncharacterized protein n=1 Tax=bioreactor metagenome TaxID=1076179 RepID=A0A645BNX8_9ZZZZ